MLVNKEYRKLYRRYLLKKAIKKRKITFWLDRKSERHVQIIAAMFFIGFILTIYYSFKTLATWSQISQIYFGLAVLFSFIPPKWLPFIYRIRKELKILLGVCALAPFITGLVLMLNFHITVNKSIQTYKVSDYQFLYYERIVMVELESKEINRHVEIRKFPLDEFNFEPDSAAYNIHNGIFGFKVVQDAWLIPKK